MNGKLRKFFNQWMRFSRVVRATANAKVAIVLGLILRHVNQRGGR
jgi:hypothetical protein